MENNRITGATVYKDLLAQQHGDVFQVFREFLTEIKPSQILEIGTAGGGLTMYIRDILNEIGLTETPIKTFEILDSDIYKRLRDNNIEVYIEDIFDSTHSKVKEGHEIIDFIKRPGTTLILVDGGFKIGEFNALSDYVRVGDYIMAHDYSSTPEYFEEHINGKIWNWCELLDTQIEEACKRNNLIKYREDFFQKVVWTCRIKGN